jgi:cytochrome d ubiquinol oxidase subunit II
MSSATIGMPEVIAGLIVLALNAYALLGGADFGGGLWDLLASGDRKEEQRTLIADSIAPIWEANHVWLIIVVVMLFTAFPSAFSTIGIVLHIPISLVLVGIVLRGSAFVFRSYGSRTKSRRRTWGLAFAIASTVAPLLLGAVIGAIASGAAGEAAGNVGRESFYSVFVAPWTNVFAICVGGFALALFAFLAAVYSTVAARHDQLREDFRKRALIGAVAVFLFAAIVLALSSGLIAGLVGNVITTTWSVPLHIVTGIAAVSAIVALWTRRYQIARVSAALQVSCILWGWAFAQYPYVIPTSYAGLTIRAAAAPRATLDLLLIGLVVGSIVLIPSLVYLYRTFSRSSLTNQRPNGAE